MSFRRRRQDSNSARFLASVLEYPGHVVMSRAIAHVSFMCRHVPLVRACACVRVRVRVYICVRVGIGTSQRAYERGENVSQALWNYTL